MRARASLLAAFLVASAAFTNAQQAAPNAPSPIYTWHAELVSFDQAAKSLVVKATLVGNAATGLKAFKAGDRVLLQWSGFDNSANGVRGVLKFDAAQSAKQSFLLPAELIAPVAQDNYVTVKLRAPDAAAAVLKDLKPGEWLTITSKHRPSGDADQVVTIRPYVQSDRS